MAQSKEISLLEATKRDIGLVVSGKLDEEYIGDSAERELSSKAELGSWSRVRLFEAVIAHEGLAHYLRDLASYQGEKPERDVKVNALLAATHLSTALNALVWDAISSLRKSGKIRLDEKQLRALENVLKPSREYRLAAPSEDVNFDPLAIEDLRSEIQRVVFDQLDSQAGPLRERNSKSQKAGTEAGGNLLGGKLPSDLEPVAQTKGIDIRNAVELSKKYDSLKIAVQGGYLVWKFANKPTLYLKDDSAYYSRKSSGGTIDEAKLQVEVISKLLSSRAKTCPLCMRRGGSEVAYLENGEVSLVCSQCERDPRVLRLIPSLPPSES